jgi:CrcB protein
MSAATWLAVALLGGAGAVGRYTLESSISERFRGGFPLGTFVVNISGSCVLGLVIGAGLHGEARKIVATGLLGSYTTFSAWMLETERPFSAGDRGVAIANIAGSLLAGLGAVALGQALT